MEQISIKITRTVEDAYGYVGQINETMSISQLRKLLHEDEIAELKSLIEEGPKDV
jgi:hypothetical protein